jgi:electron transport complex protein RnfB
MNIPDAIDALLPQTQCTRCGYPTCRAYADAIAAAEADIDRCPPGGNDGVIALAQLLGRDAKPLNPAYGSEAAPTVAFIDEDVCIGCTKCIQACPVDAIVGAAKRMHTILADECTGCGLCLPPCPVDCIALIPTVDRPLARVEVLARAAHAQRRFDARNARLQHFAGAVSGAMHNSSAATPSPPNPPLEGEGFERIAAEAAPTNAAARRAPPISRSAVLEAIARGKARRAARKEPGSQ